MEMSADVGDSESDEMRLDVLSSLGRYVVPKGIFWWGIAVANGEVAPQARRTFGVALTWVK